MHRSIPVWQTLSDSFSFLFEHLGLLCRSLLIPITLIVGLEIFFLILPFSFSLHLDFSWMLIKEFLRLVLYAWILNIACRVVITEQTGSYAWTSSETWTAIWLVFLTLILTLLSGVLALVVFAALMWLNEILALSMAILTFLLSHFYLFARFVLVFPATAMGDKASFREAWEISAGNGWRLVLLIFMVPFLYIMCSALILTLLPFAFLQSFLVMMGLFFFLVGVVAVSLAYKQLIDRAA